MVFENLTLFEVNLENSRFSASRGGSGDEQSSSKESGVGSESKTGSTSSAESTSGAESESSGGRSKALPLGLLVVLVVGALAFRRFRSGGDDGGDVGSDVGSDDESGGITIEQAAEQ